MLKFIKNDEETYEVRVATGNGSDWEAAGALSKDEYGMWNFVYGGQSMEYEDSLEETEAYLKEEFENGKTDPMAYYFGNYKYNT